MIDGSIASRGFRLLYTAAGGVNWRSAALGNRPLLASSGERAPPPPPPCIAAGFDLSSGGAVSIGMNRTTACLTDCCTVFEENTVASKTTTHTWNPVDSRHDLV